jgi:hypothetical protein
MGADLTALTQQLYECGWETLRCGEIGTVTIDEPKGSLHGTAESDRSLQHRVEHRREVAWRRIDDLQHLRGRGLLFKRFSKISLTLGEPTPQIDYQLLWIG